MRADLATTGIGPGGRRPPETSGSLDSVGSRCSGDEEDEAERERDDK